MFLCNCDPLETLNEAAEGAGANLLEVRKPWLKDGNVMTLNEGCEG